MRNCFRNPYFCIKSIMALSAVLYILSILFSIFLHFDRIQISDDSFNELSKCPLCYGTSLCEKISKFKLLQLETSMIGDETYLFNKLVNVKNVYNARYTFSERVVIKKLAHDDELKQFDENEKNCLKNAKSKCVSKILQSNYVFLTPDRFGPKVLDIEFGHCISDRIIDMIYKNYKEYLSSDRKVTDVNLLTTMKINPEPIVLQLFPEKEGWPFPSYYGACGRIIVESYRGPILLEHIDKPFKLRAKIASTLLKALQLLYENKLHVSLYLMDLGYENISYDEEKQRIYFIDAENSIIVDKERIRADNPQDWNQTYYISEFDECKEFGTCLTYEGHKLCNNYHADFNFYTACRNVLSSYASDPLTNKNFLHSIPEDVEKKWNLNKLLNECAKNSYRGDNSVGRFSVVKRLIGILENV